MQIWWVPGLAAMVVSKPWLGPTPAPGKAPSIQLRGTLAIPGPPVPSTLIQMKVGVLGVVRLRFQPVTLIPPPTIPVAVSKLPWLVAGTVTVLQPRGVLPEP